MDKLQWKPGWVPAAPDEIRRQHAWLLGLERWIIDGWGPPDTIEARFAAADTIILVDHPLYVHYWWALKRQQMCLFRPRPDGPEGCPMLPMTWQLLKMIWAIDRQALPHLRQTVAQLGQHKRVVHIRSPRELRQFLKAHC